MSLQGPSYADGHLFVAAIRVLDHREGRPPTVEEVASLLGHSREIAYHIARGLAERGIVHLLAGPFETRIEITDHTALEGLPRGEDGPAFEEDLRAFQEKKRKDRDEMGGFFAEGGVEKKKQEKLSKMEEEFRKFKKSRSGEEE